MEYLLLLGALCLVALFVLGGLIFLLATLLAWLVRISLRGRKGAEVWVRRARQVTYAGSITFLIWTVYTAIYPTDDFYLQEFEEVTLREPPSSAKVLAKSASYPAPNGDYCSFARIEVSREDFASLMMELEADSRLSRNPGPGSNDQKAKALSSSEPITSLASFVRTDPEHPDHHLSIDLLSSRQHVEVAICYT